MSLKQYTKEELQEMSFIEIAHELLVEKGQAVSFKQLMDEIQSILQLSDADVKAKIAQFYTDMNIDGRFLCVGENTWGLRVWYPVDHVVEEVTPAVKTKKKKAKKAVEEDLDEFEELDEEDLDYDDLDDLEEFDEEASIDDEEEDALDDDFEEEIEDEEFDLEEDEDLEDEDDLSLEEEDEE